MNRRDFFGFLRSAPLALPVLALNGGTPDGVQLDGKTIYLDGRKVMEQMPDGTLKLGEDGNITLFGKAAAINITNIGTDS